MKLLFLVKTPLHQQQIKKKFSSHRANLSYTIDVACVSGYVTTSRTANHYNYKPWSFEDFSLKSRAVPEGYKIIRDYLPEQREELLSLLLHNDYDYIINACGSDEAGDLMFDYTRESFDILDIPTIRFDLLAVLHAKRTKEAFQEIEDLI